MARPLRIEYAGAFYHVTSRGNERLQEPTGSGEVSLLCGIGRCAVWSGRSYLGKKKVEEKGGLLTSVQRLFDQIQRHVRPPLAILEAATGGSEQLCRGSSRSAEPTISTPERQCH